MAGWRLRGNIRGPNGVVWEDSRTPGEFYKSDEAPSSDEVGRYDGYLYATRVYNAVWNDYAELFRCAEQVPVGNVAYAGTDGEVRRSGEPRSAVGVVSDRYGHLFGGDGDHGDPSYVAVALAGRVPVETVDGARVGDLLAATGDGSVRRASMPEDAGCVVGKCVGPDPEGRDRWVEMLAGVS